MKRHKPKKQKPHAKILWMYAIMFIVILILYGTQTIGPVFLSVLASAAAIGIFILFIKIMKRFRQKNQADTDEMPGSIGPYAFIFLTIVGFAAFAICLYWQIGKTSLVISGVLITVIVLFYILFMFVPSVLQLIFWKKHDVGRIQDPDERIQQLNENYERGYYKNFLDGYYNDLALCYFEKEDFERALEMIKKSLESPLDNKQTLKDILRGLPHSSGANKWVLELNEVSFLIELKRLDEAENLLKNIRVFYEVKQDKSYLTLLNIAEARLAIGRQDVSAAEEHLRTANDIISLSKAKPNYFYMRRVQAECKILEGKWDEASVILDEVIANDPSPISRTHAIKLRERKL